MKFFRHLLRAICPILLAATVQAQTTFTPVLGLALPEAEPNSWGSMYNNNFTILDTAHSPTFGLNCTNGQVPKWSGGAFVCGEDSTGVPGVEAASVQTVAGTIGTTTGAIGVNTSQNRLEIGINSTNKIVALTDGNVATATALAANPADCTQTSTTKSYAYAIDASGTLTCAILLTIQTVEPTENDDSGDGYIIGTVWINTDGAENARVYTLTDATLGAAIWDVGGSGSGVEADTLQTVFARGKEITTANSFENAERVGDGTDGIATYVHATNGPTQNCYIGGVEGDCDKYVALNDDFTWGVMNSAGDIGVKVTHDEVGAIDQKCGTAPTTPASNQSKVYCTADKLQHKDDAGTITEITGGLKSIQWLANAMSYDATHCVAPTQAALNSSANRWTIKCADNNGGIISGNAVLLYPLSTVTATLVLYHGTTETITFAGDFAVQCRAITDTLDNTYSSVAAADVAITTAHDIVSATTASITPNGTCAAGSLLSWKYTVDATNFSANAANAHVIGVVIKYVPTGVAG